MSKAWRPVAILVVVCSFLTAAGCFSGQDYAYESGSMLRPGMTMNEVRDELGDPNQIIRGDPGTDTEWIYRYEGGPGTACTVLLVIFFVVLIVALVFSKSKGGGGGIFVGVGGSSGPPYQIRLHFSSAGRLLEVSPPHPAP
ncbi:MAG: hypothetical protein HY293_18705 [Planctomycetes bacterium]|nr:hypothetical protein [Planctomycetota bacterium]